MSKASTTRGHTFARIPRSPTPLITPLLTTPAHGPRSPPPPLTTPPPLTAPAHGPRLWPPLTAPRSPPLLRSPTLAHHPVTPPPTHHPPALHPPLATPSAHHPRWGDNFESATGSESGDNPRTPASEPAKSQPASPKKRRKVSRSQSIPAQPSNTSGFYPPPNVYAGPADPMGMPHAYNEPMPGPHMHSPMPMDMMPGSSPHPGHPMMHGGGSSLPMHMHYPGAPTNGSHPLPHPGNNARYMRQSSVPMAPPHMSPHSTLHGTPPMHPQGMSPHHHMVPNSAPSMPQQSYSPGMPGSMLGTMPPNMPPNMPSTMSSRLYPADSPVIINPSNPHAAPIYPCGMCHKEVSDADQAVLCESGCNFWFHRQCTGLTEHAYQLLSYEIYAEWVCDNCLHTKNIPLIKTKQ